MEKDDVKALYHAELRESVQRFNVDGFEAWLESNTDFFTAPCSCKGKLAYEGALLERVVATYLHIADVLQAKGCKMSESAALVSLLTGLSRVNTMKKTPEGYRMIRDATEIPIGRAERGLYYASRFFLLTEDEITALRWFDLEACKIDEYKELQEKASAISPEMAELAKKARPDMIVLMEKACKKTPLVDALQTAWVVAADVAKNRG